MIAASVNAKALSTFMGHGNVGITLDLYGHLIDADLPHRFADRCHRHAELRG